MTGKKRAKSVKFPALQAIGIGILFSCIVLVVLVACIAFAMSFDSLPDAFLTAAAIAVLVVSGLAGGYFAAKKLWRDGLRIGLLCGLVLCAVVLLLSVLVYRCFAWQFMFKVLVVAASASLGGVLGVNSRKKYR